MTRRLPLFASLAILLAGCASGGDVVPETSGAEAKAKVDQAMPAEQQQSLSAKLKGWDPKADKK